MPNPKYEQEYNEAMRAWEEALRALTELSERLSNDNKGKVHYLTSEEESLSEKQEVASARFLAARKRYFGL
ncbi:MAG TPA: hypothetical protein VLF90_00230 [Patescibacteria group bacterium]|nr:hypothetical protein [Patescibacteria group bacterium]